jgi:hypothetical protein
VAVTRALLLPLALAGTVLAVLFTALPRPSASDVIAAHVLARLQTTRIRGSVIRIGTLRLHATCTSRHRAAVVTLDDRTQLLVRQTQVRLLRAPRTLAASDSDHLSAEADLGGVRRLYLAELTGRLVRHEAQVARAIVAGRAAYRVRIDGGGPHVYLYVARATLEPIAVDYVSHRLSGRALLLRGKGC